MNEHQIDSGVAATPSGLVSRIERRLDQSRRFGRDVDALFKHLTYSMVGDWPEPGDESLELACRGFVGVSEWARRAEHPTRAMRIAVEHALTHIYRSLVALRPGGAAHAERVLDMWEASATVPRAVVTDVIVDGAGPELANALDQAAFKRGHHARHGMSGPKPGEAAVATAREYAMLRARLRAARGAVDDALDLLSDEPISDERVSLTYADIHVDAGDSAAATDKLRRSLIVASDKRAVRERLVDAALEAGDLDGAVDELLTLLEETLDVTYWEIICDLLIARAPERLAEIRAQLEAESPALNVEVLIAHGEVEGVIKASRAKTFSYQQLWRIGDFLASRGSRKAARVYERAINLHGAIAQSKLECIDLGDRIESVIPFFESIDRPTKPARLAKELLSKHKNNVPMRREFERVFGGRV